jgi:hypothetical protein
MGEKDCFIVVLALCFTSFSRVVFCFCPMLLLLFLMLCFAFVSYNESLTRV